MEIDELAQRCKAFGLNVKAYDPRIYENNKCSDIVFLDNIINLVYDIDILALTLPLNQETEGMINEEVSICFKNGNCKWFIF